MSIKEESNNKKSKEIKKVFLELIKIIYKKNMIKLKNEIKIICFRQIKESQI
jgi:hypothetical protein